MSSELLGNLGDFIGGLGVIATLFYLARQLRENTRQMEASSKASRAAATASLAARHAESSMVAAIPENSALLVKAAGGLTRLNAEERFRAVAVTNVLMLNYEAEFINYLHGMVDEETWSARTHGLRSRFSPRVMHETWARIRNEFDPRFQQYMDEDVLPHVLPFREHPAAASDEPD
jgi:hypothetical protein